jgi:hypothetical protein
MIRNIKAITASCYVAMFFLGVSASLVGAAARNIGLSPYQIGLLIAFTVSNRAADRRAAGRFSTLRFHLGCSFRHTPEAKDPVCWKPHSGYRPSNLLLE